MPRKPRLNGPERFARDFTVLVAEEAARAGKRRICKPANFEKWARSVLRGSRGIPHVLANFVGLKLRWLVYGSITFAQDRDRCLKKGMTFVRRHRHILAEQVLAGDVTEDPLDPLMMMKWNRAQTKGWSVRKRAKKKKEGRR